MIKYKIEKFDKDMGHIVVLFFDDELDSEGKPLIKPAGPWNYELPLPVPNEAGIRTFIESKIPYSYFERANKVALLKQLEMKTEHVDSMVGAEFPAPMQVQQNK